MGWKEEALEQHRCGQNKTRPSCAAETHHDAALDR